MIKRVTTGFLSIVVLLFAAGMISLFELGHLSNDAEKLMEESRSSMESAKEMFDALNDNSTAVAHTIMLGHSVRNDTLCRNSLERLEAVLASAAEHASNNAALDSLAVSVALLHELTDDLISGNTGAGLLDRLITGDSVFTAADTDSDDADDVKDIYWYDMHYNPLYTRISEQINDFMTLAFSGLTPQTEQLSRNAYRAVTPVLISLLVMIAIVLMLYYFVMIYCVLPIIGINKSLADWLKFRKAFAVKEECRDELLALRENIKTLTERADKNLN